MSMDSAFRPAGNTVLVAATSSTGIAPTNWSTGNMPNAFVTNASSVSAWIAFGSSAASGFASIPTTSTPSLGIQIPSSSYRCFTFGPNTANCGWISAVTSAGASASIFVTPGIGF